MQLLHWMDLLSIKLAILLSFWFIDIAFLPEIYLRSCTLQDVGGREMRVKFSVDISSGNRSPEALNSAPIKDVVYESPYKLYIGNISWSVKPEELRNQFSQFGIVVSARVLYDRKAGKNRAYGFLSFSSAADRDAALSLNGRVESINHLT